MVKNKWTHAHMRDGRRTATYRTDRLFHETFVRGVTNLATHSTNLGDFIQRHKTNIMLLYRDFGGAANSLFTTPEQQSTFLIGQLNRVVN